ncbi:thiol-disulfide oxidoreductase DCC family protein [Salinicoccus roseus]|uniref:thiol-disulfide oxidoreductase DCC family protein n=1 Tax=Salinicoccus roseus TaxID=45670 RepID=UPI002300DE38|nr:DCC1-like thiol-disulfide oxidoreductase family protein [Salinicoccus roseus]
MNILYFDDDCIICNRFAKIITALDRKGTIHFSSIKALEGIVPEDIDSVVYYSDDMYIHSDAVIEVAADATGFRAVRLLKAIPVCWRNALYRLIARNRYRLNDRMSCTIDPDVRKKIIS